MTDKPKYIIKVHRDWKYGPRARFWDIMKWYESDRYEQGGYWSPACRGGLAYTNWGMWRAINKRLKKMEFGYHNDYYTLGGEPLLNPVCNDADLDTCPSDDPNCIWQTYTCRWCNKDYKISKRALTGKYMISDHNKTCKEFKKKNKAK